MEKSVIYYFPLQGHIQKPSSFFTLVKTKTLQKYLSFYGRRGDNP